MLPCSRTTILSYYDTTIRGPGFVWYDNRLPPRCDAAQGERILRSYPTNIVLCSHTPVLPYSHTTILLYYYPRARVCSVRYSPSAAMRCCTRRPYTAILTYSHTTILLSYLPTVRLKYTTTRARAASVRATQSTRSARPSAPHAQHRTKLHHPAAALSSPKHCAIARARVCSPHT